MKSMYRILIVDDDQAILDMLKLQLEWENYLVDTAVNGKEALNKLTSTPDLILLDIQMEGMSGLELCQKIRQYVSVPIIFLTYPVICYAIQKQWIYIKMVSSYHLLCSFLDMKACRQHLVFMHSQHKK